MATYEDSKLMSHFLRIWPIYCGTKRESCQWRPLLSQIKLASQGTLLDLDLSAYNGLFFLPIEYLSQRCR